jgi:hypothetical protein
MEEKQGNDGLLFKSLAKHMTISNSLRLKVLKGEKAED